MVYDKRYCMFLKWCFCDYFHKTEVLSESSFACCFGVSLCRGYRQSLPRKKRKKVICGIISDVVHMHIPYPAFSFLL